MFYDLSICAFITSFYLYNKDLKVQNHKELRCNLTKLGAPLTLTIPAEGGCRSPPASVFELHSRQTWVVSPPLEKHQSAVVT